MKNSMVDPATSSGALPRFLAEAADLVIATTEGHLRAYATSQYDNRLFDSVVEMLASVKCGDLDRFDAASNLFDAACGEIDDTPLCSCRWSMLDVTGAIGEWKQGLDDSDEENYAPFDEARARLAITEALTSLPPAAAGTVEKPPRGLTSFGEIADDLAKAPQLVSNLIDPAALVIIFGQPNTGKSMIGGALGMAVATSGSFFGADTAGGDVIYVAAEGAAGFKARLRAWMEHNPGSDAGGFFLVERAVDLAEPEGVDELLKYIEWIKRTRLRKVSLVVFDTLAKCLEGRDENSAAVMGAALFSLARLQHQGCAVVLIHHPGRDVSRGPRGHTSLPAAADTILEVAATGPSTGEARVRKQRDMPVEGIFPFRIVPVGGSAVIEMVGPIACTVKPPSDLMAAHVGMLADAVGAADAAGNPLRANGKNGLDARKDELPPPLSAMGRPRRQAIYNAALSAGAITRNAAGRLSACASPGTMH